jgi:short-subunit dehydrogenase
VPTALVTGATAGIGAAFARRLARQGYDLVLVARDAERLESVAATLRTAADVDVEVLVADLTDDEQRGRVEGRLADEERPVEVLVNNAGVPSDGGILRGSVDDAERMLRLNVLAVMRLSRAVAPGMVARRRGAVVNVSSVAAFLPFGSYSASKAWVIRFTESLAVELAGTGVRSVVVCPGFVRTEFHDRAGMTAGGLPSWSWLSAEDVVAATWRGVVSGAVVVVPSRRYRAGVAVARHLPLQAAPRVAQFLRARRPLR